MGNNKVTVPGAHGRTFCAGAQVFPLALGRSVGTLQRESTQSGLGNTAVIRRTNSTEVSTETWVELGTEAGSL